MKPSFLFVSNCYPAAYGHFSVPDGASYGEAKRELSSKILDIAYLYSLNLEKLGYRTEAVLFNHEILQKKWARENGINFSDFSLPPLARRYRILRSLIGKFPKAYYSFRDFADKRSWNWQILMAQIKKLKPDVLLLFDLHYFPPQFLKEAKKYAGKIVGQTSSPIMMSDKHLLSYDLLISALPHYVERFKSLGISAAYTPYAFEPEVLKSIGSQERKYDCVFVGTFNKDTDKYPLLEKIAQKVNIDFWGYCPQPLAKSSPILPKYKGQAFGIDMFRILGQSKIAVNCHTKKVGKSYANIKRAGNVRLYEATGMGAMLITDSKENLGEMFEVGREVETYSSLEELIEKINYYLENDKERERIAQAGQERTLKDHTFEARAKQLLEIIKSC